MTLLIRSVSKTSLHGTTVGIDQTVSVHKKEGIVYYIPRNL